MSAINNSKKNKKKNNKKKNKKQGDTPVDSTTPSEMSSPALTDNDNLIQQESLTASALPAAPIEPTDGTSKIPAGGPVGVGAAGAGVTAAAVAAATKSSSNASASLPEPLPLSDNVKHCIKTAVASGSIDALSIVKSIVKNVEAGDYKAKAPLPATAKSAPVVATPPKDTPPKSATSQETSKTDSVKKAVAGAGAAVAGVGAAVASKLKGNNNKEGEKVAGNASVSADLSKLSENVQHCIKSAVQAPAVNVYGILDGTNSNKVKCPEPAVGGSTQSTMPSSAKTADTAVPPKDNEAQIKKGKENRKSGLAALKKKNCIIL